MPSAVMHFYSGQPMHFYSGVDNRLKTAGLNTSIDAAKALAMGNQFPSKIGFLVLEAYDFGNAQKINSIYNCLLKVTPFSKAEISRYDTLLRDRNLIVHHGSVFTTKYLEQSKAERARGIHDAFFDSLVIDSDRAALEIDFISDIAKKMMDSSHAAIRAYLDQSEGTLDDERERALDFFLMWEEP